MRSSAWRLISLLALLCGAALVSSGCNGFTAYENNNGASGQERWFSFGRSEGCSDGRAGDDPQAPDASAALEP